MSDYLAAWMRTVGATEATWDPNGKLLSLKLGPAPVEPDEDEDETQSSRKKLSADAQVTAARNERRRIALGASGGPVRRVGEV